MKQCPKCDREYYDESLKFCLEDSGQRSEIFSSGVPAHIYAAAGRKLQAKAMLEQLKQLRESEYVSAVGIALATVALGDREEAIRWLEKGFEERAFQMQFLQHDPRWDPIREDPRFIDLARKIGLPT